MITQQDLKNNYAPYEAPIELVKLLDFQNLKQEWYSGRFTMQVGGLGMLETYSKDKDFIASLKLIAQTSSSGTVLFLWIFDATKSMSEQPIVVFGDEGGYDVIFENVKDMLHYLSFNTAIYNADALSFVDDTYRENTRVAEYAIWLKEIFNLDVIKAEEADDLGLKSQKKYGVLFEDWMKQFVG
jgi:hypothetical protein